MEGGREASLSKLRTRYSFLPLRRPFDHGWASGGSSKNVNSTSTEMENKTPPKRKWLGLLTSFHESCLLSLHLRARREGPPKRSSFYLQGKHVLTEFLTDCSRSLLRAPD